MSEKPAASSLRTLNFACAICSFRCVVIYSNSARDFAFAINIFKFGGNASAAASECIEILDVLRSYYFVMILLIQET